MSTGLIINGLATGTVTLTLQDIITFTGNGLSIPASWLSLSISDVSTTIDTGTENYSLKFTTSGKIALPGLPNIAMDSAQFTLTATKPSSGIWDYGISFNGLVEIIDGENSFIVSIIGAFNRTGDTDKTDTWTLSATSEKNISLDSIFKLMPKTGGKTPSLGSFASTTGTIQKLQLTAKHVTTNATKAVAKHSTTYSVEIDFNWNFTLFNDITLAVDNAKIKITKDASGVKASASGNTIIHELNAHVGVVFDMTTSGGKDVSIIWEGITATYTNPKDTVTLTVKDWNIGKSIVALAKLIGMENFQLDSPWSLLNDIVLKELDIVFDFSNKDVSLSVDFESGIDLIFMSINGFTLSRVNTAISGSSTNEVLMRLNANVIDGIDTSASEWQNILGKSTSTGNAKKGQSIQNMPKVPGKGNKYLDVKYLGLGQKVTLQNTAGLNTVENALTALSEPFNASPQDGEPFPSDKLEFNGKNSWLVGTHITIVEAIELGFVFDDPDLYGLLIKINSKKKSLKAFTGLKFEILYKKISSTIGMYYIELKLPTEMRHLQFGEVAVTLPVLSLNIYTNGNFKIDLGYPKSLTNFSDSLTIQALPFTGSGGFYFAVQDEATAKGLPQTNTGTFHPVIEFGFAANFGLGKTIHKGILKAGISIVAVGAMQGTLAWFHPTTTDPSKSDLYYKLMGSVGVVGKVYGVINFVIVQASVSLVVSAIATTVLESYCAIPLKLTAKVTAHAEISIDCCFFTIHIGFSFNTHITENLTIGTSHLDKAPWHNSVSSTRDILEDIEQEVVHSSYFKNLMSLNPFAAKPNNMANWTAFAAPVIGVKEKLQFYFVPQLTLTGVNVENPTGTPEYVAMVYIDSPSMDKTTKEHKTTGTTSFEKLAQGIFTWVLNSLDGTTGKTLGQTLDTNTSIKHLKKYLEFLEDTSTLFTTADIMNFLEKEFDLYLASPEQAKSSFITSDLNAALFPMFPELKMMYSNEDADSPNPNPNPIAVNFNQFAMATPAYLTFMQTYFSELATAYEKKNGGNSNGQNNPTATSTSSIADYVFQDYFLMVAKALLQNGIDYIQTHKVVLSSSGVKPNTISDTSSLNDIVNTYTAISSENKVTVTQLAQQNGTAKIGDSKELIINGYTIEAAQTLSPSKLCEKFEISLNNFAEANYYVPNIFSIGTTIVYTDYSKEYKYITVATDSLSTIVSALQALVIVDFPVKSLTIGHTISASAVLSQNALPLNIGVSFNIPNVLYSIIATDTLLAISKTFLKTKAKAIGQGIAKYAQATGTSTPNINATTLLNTNSLTPGILKTGTVLNLAAKTYTVVKSDTLLNIIKKLICTMSELAAFLIVPENASCLNPNTSIIIPTIGYTTPAICTGQTDLTTVSHAYNVSLQDLAFSNETLSGIFKTGQSINIPNLTDLRIGAIARGILDNQDIANQANLGSRVFLHGLQLPIKEGLTYGNNNTPTIDSIESLYTLTGQQIPIETRDIINNSIFRITLSNYGPINAGLITAVGKDIAFSPNTSQLDFIANMKTAANSLDFGATYQELKAYKELVVHFPLGKTTTWKYPENLFSSVTTGSEQLNICHLPDTFIQFAKNNTTNPDKLTLNKVTQDNPTYDPIKNKIMELKWATSVKIEIKELPNNGPEGSQYYELIGVNHTDIVLLDALLTAMESTSGLINGIHLLYRPETQSKKPEGYQSAAITKQQTIITQADLSGFSSMITSGKYKTAKSHQGSLGTLNTNKEFVRLLLQASIASNGGYYLYYNDETTGKGIPSNIFNQKEIGEINLVITYNTLASLPEYVNSIVADVPSLTKNSGLYIESKDHVKPVSILPVGNYGFEITRPNTIVESNNTVTSKEFLLQNFSLLGYNITAVGTGFNGSNRGLPISPKVKSVLKSTKSIYEHVLPLYKFAKNIGTGIDSKIIVGVDMNDNPYNGIGSIATIDFNWVDLFGNDFLHQGAYAKTLPLKMTYRDEIIGLHQLPGLSIHYEIMSGILNLNLSFSTTRYNTSPSKTGKTEKQINAEQAAGKKLAEQDLYTYTSSYYQMQALFTNNGATKPLVLTNTLNKTNFDITAADVYNLYNGIILYLQSVNSTVLPPPQITTWVCNTISITTSKPIFELDVKLVIKRDATLIDPNFKYVKHVNSVTASIKPDTGEASDGSTGSLKGFVRKFETSFNTTTTNWYKVAIGDDKTAVSANTPVKKIWIVQFGTGMIDFQINSAKPLFFAPPPLANSVVNLNKVQMMSYTSTTGLSTATPVVSKNFASINLDKWASTVLTAIDDFLLPEFAIPASIIGVGIIEPIPKNGVNHYEKILNIKKQLADCISQNIVPIEGTTSPPATATITKFKEELLKKLSTANDIEVIVQNPVTVNATTSGKTNIKLFGKPVNISGEPVGTSKKSDPNYSLSTAEIDIDDTKLSDQNLIYLLTLKGPVIEDSVKLKLEFNLSHVQHQLVRESNLGSTEIGSWLSFVEPITGTQLKALNMNVDLGLTGSTRIPLLMRSYPTPPSILEQTYKTEIPASASSLVDLLKWDYKFTYTSVAAVQDESIIHINFDVKDTHLNGNEVPIPATSLPTSLANFIALYPEIKADFVSALAKVNANTTPTDLIYKTAKVAIKAFAKLTESVATEWSTWTENKQSESNITGGSSYLLTETSVSKTIPVEVNALKIAIAIASATTIPPTVSIPNSPYHPQKKNDVLTGFFIDSEGKYLTYSDRNKYPQRTLTFAGLSILKQQNAWGGVSIVRNKYLLKPAITGGTETNTGFIYQTPLVRQKNALTPFLIQKNGFDIAKLIFKPALPAPAKIGDYLNAILVALFPAETMYAHLALKFQCNYSYAQTAEGIEKIVLPIVLTTPYKYSKPGATGNINIKQLGAHIATWVLDNHLSVNTAPYASEGPYHYNGKLNFKLEMYSNKNVHTPIAVLDDLFLKVASVDWSEA